MKFSALLMISLMVVAVVYADDNKEEKASISCYVCNSVEDSSCDDAYTPSDKHKQACENGETFCRKTVQSVRGEKSVIRQCAKELYKDEFEGCYSTAGKSTQNVCTCKATDGPCNSGIMAKSSFGALVLSVVVAKFFF